MEEYLKQEWTHILENMKKEFEIGDVPYNTFLLPLKIHSVEGNTVTIITSENDVGIDFVKKKYYNALKYSIGDAINMEVDIVFTTLSESEDSKSVKPKVNSQAFNLNPKYTFDTFVVGDTNRHAHALSLAVAESPGTIYNPLFLYGGAGLGKTHLMHAIAHHIIENNPGLKVLYTTSEQFTNDLIESLKNNPRFTNADFRDKYRNIDVLLIDDIQFLIGKISTQEEFFHTLNSLTDSNRAVIICSDRPPKDLETLNERLVSRFEMGGMSDIQMPTYETKMAILSKKEDMEGFSVPNDVKSYIANNINSSIRQLEGALVNLISYSRISKTEITVEFAERVLKDVISPNETKHAITPEYILSIVAEHYSISPEEIISKKRTAKIALPRHIVMFLCRELTNMTLDGIGEFLGNRDHSTTDHGIKNIEGKLTTDSDFARTLDVIKNKINPS